MEPPVLLHLLASLRSLFQVELLTQYLAGRGQWLRFQLRAVSPVARLQPSIPSAFTHGWETTKELARGLY